MKKHNDEYPSVSLMDEDQLRQEVEDSRTRISLLMAKINAMKTEQITAELIIHNDYRNGARFSEVHSRIVQLKKNFDDTSLKMKDVLESIGIPKNN